MLKKKLGFKGKLLQKYTDRSDESKKLWLWLTEIWTMNAKEILTRPPVCRTYPDRPVSLTPCHDNSGGHHPATTPTSSSSHHSRELALILKEIKWVLICYLFILDEGILGTLCSGSSQTPSGPVRRPCWWSATGSTRPSCWTGCAWWPSPCSRWSPQWCCSAPPPTSWSHRLGILGTQTRLCFSVSYIGTRSFELRQELN